MTPPTERRASARRGWTAVTVAQTVLIVVAVVVSLGLLISTVADQRAAAERSEARATAIVRGVLEEVRNPEEGSARADLFDRVERIERIVEQLCEATDGCAVDP